MKVARSIGFVACAALAILTCASPGHAGVRPGIEAGVNVASLSHDDDDQLPFIWWDRSWLTSFSAGATLEIPIRDRVAIETGVVYVRHGLRVRYDTTPDGQLPALIGRYRFMQDYVSAPLLIRFRPLPSRRWSFSLGPEFAVLVSARLVGEMTSPFVDSSDDDIKDNLKPTNVSVDARAAYEFPLENHVGVVSVRYSHGLTGVAKEDDWISDWRTRGVQTMLGLRW